MGRRKPPFSNVVLYMGEINQFLTYLRDPSESLINFHKNSFGDLGGRNYLEPNFLVIGSSSYLIFLFNLNMGHGFKSGYKEREEDFSL